MKVFVKLQKDVFVYATKYICLNYKTYLSIMETISILKIKMKTQDPKKKRELMIIRLLKSIFLKSFTVRSFAFV